MGREGEPTMMTIVRMKNKKIKKKIKGKKRNERIIIIITIKK